MSIVNKQIIKISKKVDKIVNNNCFYEKNMLFFMQSVWGSKKVDFSIGTIHFEIYIFGFVKYSITFTKIRREGKVL